MRKPKHNLDKSLQRAGFKRHRGDVYLYPLTDTTGLKLRNTTGGKNSRASVRLVHAKTGQPVEPTQQERDVMDRLEALMRSYSGGVITLIRVRYRYEEVSNGLTKLKTRSTE